MTLTIFFILLIADIISIPIFAVTICKKYPKGKRLKKILSFIVAVAVIDAAYGIINFDKIIMYDSKGTPYLVGSESINYYDKDGNTYTVNEINGYKFFVTDGGKTMYLADRVYIGEDGYIIYDRKNEIKESTKNGVFLDENGKIYFKAEKVRMDSKGKIKNFE